MMSWDTILWAATVAGVFGGATLFAEKLMSRQRHDDIAALIHLRDDCTWVDRFLSAFDALFTARNFSLARLVRSIAATAFGVLALWVLFDPILGLMDTRADQVLPLWQALTIGIAINFLADFLSLAETRWVLNRFRHVRSVLGHVALLLVDFVFTAVVIWVAIALFRMTQGEPVLHPVELIMAYSAYAIFFYSTFLTSVWAWGYALAILVVRILSSKPVEDISNFEKPFAWLAGLVSVMVFGMLLAFEMLGRALPDDIGLQSCTAFGGTLCTHEARLTTDQERILVLLSRACETGDTAQCLPAFNRLGTREGIQAARLLEAACQFHNSMSACNTAGVLYAQGLGMAQNFFRARDLYTRACEGGNMFGCSNLGWFYEVGRAVPRDIARAYRLFDYACERDHMPACRNLADLYARGRGVVSDVTKARTLYLRACDDSYLPACSRLGRSYLNAVESEPNLELAKHYFTRACEGEDASGCYELGMIHYDTAYQVPEDQGPDSNDVSQPCGNEEINDCVVEPVIVVAVELSHPEELAAADTLFRQACRLENFSACRLSAETSIALGFGIPQEISDQENQLGAGCDSGRMLDCMSLVRFYEEVLYGSRLDGSDASVLTTGILSRACDSGQITACNKVAWRYETGYGLVQEDLDRAHRMYALACEGGIGDACDSLRALPQTE